MINLENDFHSVTFELPDKVYNHYMELAKQHNVSVEHIILTVLYDFSKEHPCYTVSIGEYFSLISKKLDCLNDLLVSHSEFSNSSYDNLVNQIDTVYDFLSNDISRLIQNIPS